MIIEQYEDGVNINKMTQHLIDLTATLLEQSGIKSLKAIVHDSKNDKFSIIFEDKCELEDVLLISNLGHRLSISRGMRQNFGVKEKDALGIPNDDILTFIASLDIYLNSQSYS